MNIAKYKKSVSSACKLAVAIRYLLCSGIEYDMAWMATVFYVYFNASLEIKQALKDTIRQLKVIPWYCIAHPYCARFSRH